MTTSDLGNPSGEFTRFHRAKSGVMSTIVDKLMPSDPEALFVWPQLVFETNKKYYSLYRMAVISATILVVSFPVATMLVIDESSFLQLPLVALLGIYIDKALPETLSLFLAFAIGIAISYVFLFGKTGDYSASQSELRKLSASRFKIYDLLLKYVIRQEQVVRSGSENWSWPQKIVSSFLFGSFNLATIWISTGIGIAFGLVSVAFTVVYHYFYNRNLPEHGEEESQLIAVSASSTVHAMYIIQLMLFWSPIVTGLILFGIISTVFGF